ncbi:hypothetical protein SAMN05216409_11884 [Pseudomonas lutea]|uniref:Uncharacterized protein n=1 Tax=Pseudomonas lutea TaxID=243924 RepID=A0A9X8MH63_9PSED|nr:hypothetical protein SAMN05216409_11884 [Pseudomonas lutea]
MLSTGAMSRTCLARSDLAGFSSRQLPRRITYCPLANVGFLHQGVFCDPLKDMYLQMIDK